MRVRGAIDHRRRPYGKLGILITMWSFLIVTIFETSPAVYPIEAISPTSNFEPIAKIFTNGKEARCLHAHKALKEYFRKEVYRIYSSFMMVKRAEAKKQAKADLRRARADRIKILFSPEGGCEASVIRAIRRAKVKIDAAIYDFTNENIAEALLTAKSRGVAIRLFLDKGCANKAVLHDLEKAGIAIRYDRRKHGLMHNKFMIIDRKNVISGSYNWTPQAEKANRENLIVFPYTEDFQQEFNSLWDGMARSPHDIRAPPSVVKAAFSPKGGCEEEILRSIRDLKESPAEHPHADIALYYFTNKDIADELFDASAKGAEIRILLDKAQKHRNDSIEKYLSTLDKRSKNRSTRQGSLKIRYYRIKNGLMHNKFAVIGNATLTGSYNWTKSAENKNQENLIVLPYAVEDYIREFNRLWKDSADAVRMSGSGHLLPPARGPPVDKYILDASKLCAENNLKLSDNPLGEKEIIGSFRNKTYEVREAKKGLIVYRVFDMEKSHPNGRYFTVLRCIGSPEETIQNLALYDDNGIFNKATYMVEVKITKGARFACGYIERGDGEAVQIFIPWKELSKVRFGNRKKWNGGKWILDN